MQGGLSYSQRLLDGHSTDEYEALVNDDIEQTVLLSKLNKTTTNVFGGIAKVGINYTIFPQWQVGMPAQYQKDSVASVTQFALTTRYQF